MSEPIHQAAPLASYLACKSEIDQAIDRVLQRGLYILGPECEAFEAEFAAHVGVGQCVGVASGTDALELALRAVGVSAGQGVVTVSNSAVATAAAIERAGAVPLFCDVDAVSLTMDPGSLAEVLRRSPIEVGAVLPVHLYGAPARMAEILAVTDAAGVPVVEDCAQAHGASISGRAVGSWGKAAAFSFYPTKNLGAIGDGGAVLTDDSGVADHVRRDRQYGWVERYVSSTPGFNSRLDELQAAILRAKLPHLGAETERRRAIAAQYDRGLSASPAVLPGSHEGHVFHQFVIRTATRDALRESLAEQEIGTAIHYPRPIHRQPAYQGRLPEVVSLQNTEAAAEQILSLPMHVGLTDPQVEAVTAAVLSHQGRAV